LIIGQMIFSLLSFGKNNKLPKKTIIYLTIVNNV